MLLQADRLSSQFPLRPLSVLVFHLLLTHSCRGESQLMGPPQPIVATFGHDVILPCHLEPEMDVTADTLEWTRSDLYPIFVNVLRAGQDLEKTRNPSYKGRTSLFRDELKHGNISLKLSKVELSDLGTYTCDIPLKHKQSSVKLVFASGPSSPPVISLSGLDGQSGGVVLQCESAGWYPEPEVLWLDAEGKLLSAGPPETVRGPGDLYTVSSRVTVEKRPSNSFTCRVQHHNTTRTTQTHFHVPDEFFKLQSSSSSIIIGLAISLAVCILLLLAVSFFCVWRVHIFKTKRKRSDEDDKGEKKNRSKTKDQFLNEGERGQLMKPDAVHMEALKGNVDNKSKPKNQSEQQLLEEQRRREEAEKEVQTLKEELRRREDAEKEVQTLNEEERRREEAEKEVQTLKEQLQNKKKEVESKESELQDLHAEKQRNQNELQSLKKHLENKKREVGTVQKTINSISTFDWGSKKEEQKKKKAEVEQEVETLEKKLESRQKETDTNITECEVKEAEVQQLQEEVQRMETSLQTLMESSNMELERSPAAEASSSSSSPFKLKILSRNKWQEMKKRREEAEEEVSILKEKLQNETRELEEREQAADSKWKKTDEELKETRTHLESKEEEINQLGMEFEKKLQEEKRGREEAEREVKDLKKEFQTGHFEGSYYSQSMEPPRTPPNTQTSDSGFHIQVDPHGKYIRLINSSTEDKDLGEWHLDLQVNNKTFMYRFDRSFYLRAGGFVNMWAAGHGPKRSPTDLEWKGLKPWCSGDRLKFSLYSHTGEMQYERSV